MNMEDATEAMAAANTNSSSSSASNDHYHGGVAKGKRTKRLRLPQSPAPAVAVASPSFTSSSGEFSGSTTEEEEDMANCLILLAQGRAFDAGPKPGARVEEEGSVGGGGGGRERCTSRRLTEAATTTGGKVGFYVYECKTCNKCFPSFQALGGHRTSHKKPKTVPLATVVAVEKRARHVDDILQISIASYSTANTNSANNNKQRVHECSICGSEFSSGQALGGHMRRHRPAAAAPETTQDVKVEKSLLSLDLNLPAPMEEERGDVSGPASFPYATKPPLVLSASALVGCHY